MTRLLSFYEKERASGGKFDAGHRERADLPARQPAVPVPRRAAIPRPSRRGTVYRISDLELASRLSFFLWSSIPDDELLDLADRGPLHEPAVLEQQVRRMLADERARALGSNFAGQWLYLRNLAERQAGRRRLPGLRR